MILNLFKKNKNISFIVGTGRSGTTILAKTLNANSKICIPPELQILFEYSNNGKRLYDVFKAGDTKYWNAEDFIKHVENISPNDFKKFFDYESFFRSYKYPVKNISKLIQDLYLAIAKAYDKNIFLEQTPWYGQRLDIIKELFPEAKIIHMVRDGRDVALSFARTPWWHNDPLQNLDRWAFESKKISEDLKKYFKPTQYLEIRYEDFVAEPEKKLNDICRLLDVKFEKARLNPNNLISYEEYSKGYDRTKDIYSKEFNQWKENKNVALFSGNVYGWKKNQDIFENISQSSRDALIYFGYES